MPRLASRFVQLPSMLGARGPVLFRPMNTSSMTCPTFFGTTLRARLGSQFCVPPLLALL